MKKKSVAIGAIALITLVIIVKGWIYAFGPHFPYVNWAPWDLAHYLVKNDRPASECLDLIFFEILAPTQAEQRALCVHEYAKITKDPSACELLMPSNYGLSCLGAAQATRDACSIDYATEVAWPIGEGPDDWQKATMVQCKKGTPQSEQGKKCCYILKLTSEPGIDDCSRFEGDSPFMNICLSQLALKKADEGHCSNITDANKKEICVLQARYTGKY